MNKSKLWIGIVLVVIVVGGLVVFTKSNNSTQPTTTSSPNSTQANVSTDDSLIIGEADAPITIVEFFDYKCPTCNNFHQQIEPEIKKDYVDSSKVKFQLVTLPNIGLDARIAAEGAYCALDQDKFEQYHVDTFNYIWEKLHSKGEYGSDDVFTAESLSAIAKTAGLDTAEFDRCVEQKSFTDLVDRDLKLSAEKQATGTPTFFIGEQRIVGAQPYTVFRSLIEQQL